MKEVCAGGGICIMFNVHLHHQLHHQFHYGCVLPLLGGSCVCVMGRKAGSPSRHERLKVRVGSISFLIWMSASSTMAPQWLRSTSYCCMWGLSGFSGSCVADRMLASVGYTILFASSNPYTYSIAHVLDYMIVCWASALHTCVCITVSLVPRPSPTPFS